MQTKAPEANPVRVHPARSAIGLARDLVITARPLQWQKNLLLYTPLIFSARTAWSWRDPDSWLPLLTLATVGFLLFNAVSSGGYLINDALDAERDREHPRKHLRPVAAGRVGVATAMGLGVGLMIGGVLLGFVLRLEFGAITLAYVALTVTYSLVLKNLVIVDVIAVASGFALRAVAGALVISVPISPWLYVCTILAALFIAVSKRRQELVLLGSDAGSHRSILREYDLGVLDQMASMAGAATIVSYALYAVTAENLPDNNLMLLTLPFVIYGIFRYRLIAARHPERNADELIPGDLPLLIAIVLFAVTALVVLALEG